MPLGWLQEHVFYTPEKKKEINRQQREAAARNPAAQRQKPETQAERTARINAGAREMATPKGFELTGAAGMMSGRTQPNPQKPAATAQPQQNSGSVVRMGGTEYNMGDPKQKAAYEAAQKAELERQRSRSPMADIRGGDGQKSSGNGRFTAPPTRNPNGVDQTGTNTGFKGSGFAEANGLLDDWELLPPDTAISQAMTCLAWILQEMAAVIGKHLAELRKKTALFRAVAPLRP